MFGFVTKLLAGSNPYVLGAKLLGIGLVVSAVVFLCFSYISRGQKIDTLTAWQQGVVMATTDATVTPDAKGIRKPLDPSAVVHAIDVLHQNFINDEATMQRRSDEVADAKLRADNADKALAASNVIFEKQYNSATKRIDALQATKTAPTSDLKCQKAQTDSKAGWEAWK